MYLGVLPGSSIYSGAERLKDFMDLQRAFCILGTLEPCQYGLCSYKKSHHIILHKYVCHGLELHSPCGNHLSDQLLTSFVIKYPSQRVSSLSCSSRIETPADTKDNVNATRKNIFIHILGCRNKMVYGISNKKKNAEPHVILHSTTSFVILVYEVYF